jgi:MFS family permease
VPSSDKLLNKGFLSLLFTQLFGAINDSILKQVLILAVASGGIWADRLGSGGQGYIALCLTIPFILLSGFAGQFADKLSKRRIAVTAKIAEIGIAAIGLAAFMAGNLWAGMITLVLLAIQSAFFGPAKYGMIPELVGDKHLSQANGTINMFTNLAVIGGTLVAGSVYGHYAIEGTGTDPAVINPAMLWVPGVAFLVLAILGLLPSLCLPKLQAFQPDLKFNWNIFRPYVASLKEMSKSSLLLVALAWAFFYMVGMMALLLIPDFSELLNISPKENNNLLGVLGISIGLGSVTAGIISGKHIEPRLIPVGAVGMTIFFLLLGRDPESFWGVAGFLGGAGFFAGFYIVPLQSLLQHLSPVDERGRFLGTANALSFVFSSIGSALVLLCRGEWLSMPANSVFLVSGGLSFVGTGFLLWRLRKLFNDPKARGGSHPA